MYTIYRIHVEAIISTVVCTELFITSCSLAYGHPSVNAGQPAVSILVSWDSASIIYDRLLDDCYRSVVCTKARALLMSFTRDKKSVLVSSGMIDDVIVGPNCFRRHIRPSSQSFVSLKKNTGMFVL